MTQDTNRAVNWIRQEIRDLQAYHVPAPGNMIKLDAMENPYAWPQDMRQTWLDVLRGVQVNRYPDAACSELIAQLRETLSVPESAALMLGNGSDELIQILAMAVAGAGRSILAPAPTFVMYGMIATFTGMQYRPVMLQEDFSLDMHAMLDAIAETDPALVFLSYPNNPTGNLFARDQVERIIEASPGLVVVDEAYHAFAGDSFLGRVGDYPNLLVMRTLSKIGLAGLRLGLLAGPAELINELNKIRLPYNIGVLTQATARVALQHYHHLLAQTRTICEERAMLYQALASRPALMPYESAANFILFRVAPGSADRVFAGLREQGVLIKNLSGAGGLLQDCLRVTVGRPEENQAFLQALDKAL